MAIDREAIASALFRVGSGAANFATASRRLRHWADVAPAEMPALFMSEKGARAETRSSAFNTPVVWLLDFDFYVYAHSSDPYLSPAMILNPLLDALERAIPLDPIYDVQLLGLEGMVQYTRIQGRVETDEGVLGDLAIAIVPVEVLAV